MTAMVAEAVGRSLQYCKDLVEARLKTPLPGGGEEQRESREPRAETPQSRFPISEFGSQVIPKR